MRATIVITTKNRRDDLRTAVRSALTQSAATGVLVVDDGSTDGTSDMLRAEFPTVRVERSEQSLGYVVQRNRAASLADDADVIVSIDDDAAFTTPDVIGQTLADFAGQPRVGAVAIPVIDVRRDGVLRQRAPDSAGDAVVVTNVFVGTAHAIRRDLFLALGGYRATIFHQGEERDLCARMLDRGHVVRLGRADPIHHFESPRRDTRRMDLYGRRNDVLFAWHNVPWPNLPVHLIGTTLNGINAGVQLGRPLRMMRGLLMGYGAIIGARRNRRPVSGKTYRLTRRLVRAPLLLSEIEPLLPALPDA